MNSFKLSREWLEPQVARVAAHGTALLSAMLHGSCPKHNICAQTSTTCLKWQSRVKLTTGMQHRVSNFVLVLEGLFAPSLTRLIAVKPQTTASKAAFSKAYVECHLCIVEV